VADGQTLCTTDELVVVPWTGVAPRERRPVPHLVLAWLHEQPERAGEVAAVVAPAWLGRPHGAHPDEPPLAFARQRPGRSEPAGAFDTTSISRRQLRLTPLEGGRLHVENAGKRALLHNGVPVPDCVAAEGDTLLVEDVALFLLEARAPVMAPLPCDPGLAFPFGEPDPHGMVGESPAAWALRGELAAAALADGHVLLWGPTGAGKELAARAVHGLSARRGGPFVARNAATLPPSLLDAELFGHARDYPAAGMPERPGLVGAADRGYLLLDEIGELGADLQAHLLRLLDAGGQYQRLGDSQPRRSELRLIGATNRDPMALKHDLLARFGFRIVVAGLEARRSDLPLLVNAQLGRLARDTPAVLARFRAAGRGGRPLVEPRLLDALLRHEYAEHTRELHRLLGVALSTSPGDFLALTPAVEAALDRAAAALAGPPGATTPGGSTRPPPGAEAVTPDQVLRALAATRGRVGQAASLLGLSRFALRRLLERRGIDRFSGAEATASDPDETPG